MSLTISHWCLLSLAVFPNSMEFLHVSHCLYWLLAFSHFFFQLPGVAACLSLSRIVAGCLSLTLRSHRVATCL